MNGPLSKLSVKVVQGFDDGDEVIGEYEMPIALDDLTRPEAGRIVAYYLNQMGLELKGLDTSTHRMQ